MQHRIVRLALVVTAVALVVLGLPLAIAAGGLLRADEVARLERTALLGAGQVNSALGRGDALELPRVPAGVQLGVYDADGARVAGAGPARADAATTAALAGHTTDDVVGGRTVVAVPVRDAEQVIGASRAAGAPGAVARRTALAVGAILAVAALALVVAWLVARRAARRLSGPVGALAAVAKAHADGDLRSRAELSGIAELDEVALGMNASAAAVAEALTRERAFADEASHQLRTPLTRVRWGLEEAIDGDPEQLRSAAAAAVRDIADLDHSVRDLLDLTRSAPAAGSTDMTDELRGTAERWTGPLAARGRRLLLEIDHDRSWRIAMPVEAVRHVLQVLVENAEQHGSGAVTVRLRDAIGGESDDVVAVDVLDEGEFVGSWPVPGPPEPGQPHGIGLLMAQRLAAQARGRVVLSARRPTTVTLFAPRATDAR
ncbi:sensor histidine kinase [Cellulomonas sp. ICMP 17802]|uniref:sensor histidine kinase n=1 Tax=Cellulomonas sp. ICMP 17802 TaxID=3239199 RepID=UPI00351B8134